MYLLIYKLVLCCCWTHKTIPLKTVLKSFSTNIKADTFDYLNVKKITNIIIILEPY